MSVRVGCIIISGSRTRSLFFYYHHRSSLLPSTSSTAKCFHRQLSFCNRSSIRRPVATCGIVPNKKHLLPPTLHLPRVRMMSSLNLIYPEVKRDVLKENIHGHQVIDAYRWLEDPDSDETVKFVQDQQALWSSVSRSLPFREELKKKLSDVYNYEKYSVPFKRGNNYFYYYNAGLQNQSSLYVQDDLSSEARLFLDPNTLATDGTASLGATSFSEGFEETGKLFFAYGVSRSGSDWQTIFVKDALSGEALPDVVEWAKFSGIAWTKDDKGFFYSRYPEPKKLSGTDPNADDCKRGSETDQYVNHQVRYHRLGTEQKDDLLIFEDKENLTFNHYASVSDDGKYLIITTSDGCKNQNKVTIARLSGSWYDDAVKANKQEWPLGVMRMVDNFDASFKYVLNDDDIFYFVSNLDAPRNRVVKATVSLAPVWEEVIAEPGKNAVLDDVSVVNNDLIVANYLEDVKSVVRFYKINGELLGDLKLPGIGSVYSDCLRRGTELFFKFVSFTNPGDIYRVDFSSWTSSAALPEPTLFRAINVPGLQTSELVTKQVFYPSKDGTLIPMFILHKKGLELNGSNPLLLYGYGGFNISLSPSFNPIRMPFVQDFGGVMAIPNLRGGGEYGEDWHQLGTFGNKQNVFDDFQTAAEYLIAEGYTSKSKLAIHGGSNGGLLVAACLNQRPDLFACGIASVGVLDMLRFHKFTIGHAWRTDYGDPEKAEDFEYLIKYSPFHNIPTTTASYPATLLTTADHDDRVVPLHSFKFIAELQHKLSSTAGQKVPLVIRIESKAGHGAGKPTSKILEEYADIYSFILYSFGVTSKL